MAKIQGSSAIAAVNFGENNAVEVQFQGNDKLYGFVAKENLFIKSVTPIFITNLMIYKINVKINLQICFFEKISVFYVILF